MEGVTEQEKLSCSICGEENDDVFHTLKCNHTFHYNCLLLSFKNMKTNCCPYCRSSKNKLPIVNGLKKIIPTIHSIDSNKFDSVGGYSVKKCEHILTRGKNKGDHCSKNCKLGYSYCTMHYKNHIKDEGQVVV